MFSATPSSRAWAIDRAEIDDAAQAAESQPLDLLKHAAALRALEDVREGMLLGLGSGSTAEIWLAELATRVRSGLHVRGVPTSRRVESLASGFGIPLTILDAHEQLDMTVDGADEVEPATLGLLKGLGGALVREKLVAHASRQEVIVVDDAKLVARLGERQPVCVAVVPFGWRHTARRLERLNCACSLRLRTDGAVFVSDDGLYVLDCTFGPIAEPERLSRLIDETPGVVEHGLFVGLAHRVVIASPSGVQVLSG